MLHLITGGSGSGKSEYAENWLVNCGNPLSKQPENAIDQFVYVATMEPFGKEAMERIKRHRKMRSAKGFYTMDCYRDLKELVIPEHVEFSGILLECMSNLVANELYLADGSMRDGEVVIQDVLDGVNHLMSLTDRLAIVTNEVTSDGIRYSKETKEYQRILGEINQLLARQSDLVTEVVYGIPIHIKK